jgi:uncharacterized repeat protein (TIGR01451 family)
MHCVTPRPARSPRATIWCRGFLPGVLGLALAGVGAHAAVAQSPGPATSAPVPATSAPATAAPPAVPTSPVPRPPDSRHQKDEPAPQPTAPPPDAPTPDATRTRRPTRTPRTTVTPTGTAAVAGALRVTVAQDPLIPTVGGTVTFVLTLENRADTTVQNVTLDVTLPDEVVLTQAEPAQGQITTAGSLARWFVPTLDPAATAELRLPATVRRLTEVGSRLCVLLLSTASPLEQCVAFRVDAGLHTPVPDLGAGSGDAAVPAGDHAPGDTTGLLPTLGWGMVIVGLAGLGVWFGLRLRGRATDTAGAMPPDEPPPVGGA